MIIVVVETIHLLNKIVTGVIVSGTALVICGEIFIAYIGNKIKNSGLVLIDKPSSISRQG
jgi:hypothetical protein